MSKKCGKHFWKQRKQQSTGVVHTSRRVCQLCMENIDPNAVKLNMYYWVCGCALTQGEWLMCGAEDNGDCICRAESWAWPADTNRKLLSSERHCGLRWTPAGSSQEDTWAHYRDAQAFLVSVRLSLSTGWDYFEVAGLYCYGFMEKGRGGGQHTILSVVLQRPTKTHLVENVNVSSMKLTWMEKTAGDKPWQIIHTVHTIHSLIHPL